MKRTEQLIERSYSMLIASYWLARCGVAHDGKASLPPSALGVSTWKAAYDSFFDAMGDGRSPSQFRNSMKNARDTFDIRFDNGRIGWVDRNGHQPSLSPSFERIHDEWKDRSDQELERFVLGLHAGMPITEDGTARSPEARTEGGEKVYVSRRRERDPKLRDDARAIHGCDCMACGFNFERTYGEFGKGFIEVHHVVPLAEAGKTLTDPATDLIVLCANCHRMMHRQSGVCLSLDELKRHLERSEKKQI
jgi:5-methylcytosine-specific restriction enzyme A